MQPLLLLLLLLQGGREGQGHQRTQSPQFMGGFAAACALLNSLGFEGSASP